jgi:hypothetical protein
MARPPEASGAKDEQEGAQHDGDDLLGPVAGLNSRPASCSAFPRSEPSGRESASSSSGIAAVVLPISSVSVA